MDLIIGFLLGLAIGGLAWRMRALTRSGALAAALVGGLVFGLGGPSWAALLLAFFISSSVLSRLFASRKRQAEEKFAKGTRRDWAQVLANGGLGAGLALIHALDPDAVWTWAAYAGAVAAVTADTWATEVGVLSRRPARLVTTGAAVEAGTSGAITPLGLGASLAGAGLIGLLGAAAAPAAVPGPLLFGAVLLSGFLASLIDSLAGATVHAIYLCEACGRETEQHPIHSCGGASAHIRGWRWLDNDLVNLAASGVGAAGAVLVVAGGSLL